MYDVTWPKNRMLVAQFDFVLTSHETSTNKKKNRTEDYHGNA